MVFSACWLKAGLLDGYPSNWHFFTLYFAQTEKLLVGSFGKQHLRIDFPGIPTSGSSTHTYDACTLSDAMDFPRIFRLDSFGYTTDILFHFHFFKDMVHLNSGPVFCSLIHFSFFLLLPFPFSVLFRLRCVKIGACSIHWLKWL